MTTFYEALGWIAPFYNLFLTAIVAYLFYGLYQTRTKGKKVYLEPWKYMAFALGVFVVEIITTILRSAQVLDLPYYINGYFELAIISLFIYALLLQKQHMER